MNSHPRAAPSPAISGLIPVLATPFDRRGQIAFDEFVVGIEKAAEAGCDGVMAPGFASEFHKLDAVERTELEAVMLAKVAHHPGLKSIVSVPDHSTTLAVRRAVEAVERGADAINLLPPFFLSPSVAEVEAHIGAVLDAVPATPVVLQYAPSQTSGGFPMSVVHRLTIDHPNLVTIKVESSPPGPTITALREASTPVSTLVGYAGLHLIDALRRGADGVQPGGSFTEIYRSILDDWSIGDRPGAISLHRSVASYLVYWMSDVELIVQVEKRIAHLRGWFASDHCRSPRRVLDSEELAQIDRFMDEFSEWFS